MRIPEVLGRRRSPARPASIRRLAAGIGVALLISCAAGAGCAWVALGYNSVRYPTTRSGESANVVIYGTTAYGTLADRGLEIVDLADPSRRRTIPPPAGSESVDDLAVADGLLFALDARRPGHLSVFSLSDPATPVLASAPVEVEVGPFSGVSAGGGRVIVSGGTSRLSLRTYDREGRPSPAVGTIDLGRGQPDVLMAPDGTHAFVSTHYGGPHFGLTILEIGGGLTPLVKAGSVPLDTYGFTAGGAKPANFPIEGALAGNVLMVAHAPGLAILSLVDAKRPRLLRVVALDVKAVNLDVEGGAAAVVGSSPKPLLVLFDVTNPSTPIVKQSLPLPEGSYATSVAVGAAQVVVAAHRRGLLVFQRQGWSLRPERKTR
jgi:LVIVD repeat